MCVSVPVYIYMYIYIYYTLYTTILRTAHPLPDPGPAEPCPHVLYTDKPSQSPPDIPDTTHLRVT